MNGNLSPGQAVDPRWAVLMRQQNQAERFGNVLPVEPEQVAENAFEVQRPAEMMQGVEVNGDTMRAMQQAGLMATNLDGGMNPVVENTLTGEYREDLSTEKAGQKKIEQEMEEQVESIRKMSDLSAATAALGRAVKEKVAQYGIIIGENN